MKRRAFLILSIAGLFGAILHTAAWSVNNFLMTGPKVMNTRTMRELKYSDFGLQMGNGAFPRSRNSQSVSAPGPAEDEGKDHNPFVSVIPDDDGNVWYLPCQAYLTYSSSVAAGAHSGMEECKFQFGWERWNCPESALQLSTHNRLRSATRETSFVHAISSAGVMYTLTRNCSMGDFESCGCDDSRNGRVGGRGWVWGGCSDNVEFGERISKLFVDALETGHDTRALINLHNNEVGRLAVKATMKRTCKCHGVSGSCSIQTCWLQLAEFREIGNYLKIKYDQAHKLEMDKRRMRAGNSADSRGATAETFHHVHATELVFLEDSPDYCTRNASLGHHGTEGRECLQTGKNLSQWERRSCRRLCTECGLRVEERRTEVVASCNCKFHWCCTVRCEQCRQLVAKHFCTRHDTAAPNHVKQRNKGHKR